MFQKYVDWAPRTKGTIQTLDAAFLHAETLVADGITPTLRQLYYLLVAEGVIENTKASEKSLRSLLLNARMAGRFDWDWLQDRTIESIPRAHTLEERLARLAPELDLDLWRGQAYRPEVWTEKETLVPFVRQALKDYQVPVRTLGGTWPSAGFIRGVVKEHLVTQAHGQVPYVVYLGDHDALGLSLEEDFTTRLGEMGSQAKVVRLAADWSECYDSADIFPMPEPETDQAYIDAFSQVTFEPEAYDPRALRDALRSEVWALANHGAMTRAQDFRDAERARLQSLLWEDTDSLLDDTVKVPAETIQHLVGTARETADTTRARALKAAVLSGLGDLA